MSRSREDKAADILLLAELTGRGIKWSDYVQKTTGSGNANTADEVSESWDSYASKIRYLMPRSAAGWKPEFQNVLSSSHSMRVTKVSMDRKNIMRGGHGVCMACGRKEKNCNSSIDFAGSFDGNDFVSNIKNLTPGYIKFMKDYDKVFSKAFLKCSDRQFFLPEQDKGTYIVGETCLRKAKIMFSLQTMMLERSYDAEHEIRGAKETFIGCTVDEKSIDAFIKHLDTLELAIADEKRAIPPIPNDSSYWDVLDEGRSIASNADADKSARLTYERAKRVLRSMAEEDEDEEVEEVEEEIGDEADDGSESELEEEDEDEEEDGSESDVESQPKRRRLRRSSAATVVSDEDEDEPVEKSTGTKQGKDTEAHLSGSETSQNNRPMSSRSVPPSIQDFAGRQRADGNLPSRKASLLALMDLQMRLGRRGDFQDCAICSNAILTLQELIAKVEELRHTVGI